MPKKNTNTAEETKTKLVETMLVHAEVERNTKTAVVKTHKINTFRD